MIFHEPIYYLKTAISRDWIIWLERTDCYKDEYTLH